MRDGSLAGIRKLGREVLGHSGFVHLAPLLCRRHHFRHVCNVTLSLKPNPQNPKPKIVTLLEGYLNPGGPQLLALPSHGILAASSCLCLGEDEGMAKTTETINMGYYMSHSLNSLKGVL